METVQQPNDPQSATAVATAVAPQARHREAMDYLDALFEPDDLIAIAALPSKKHIFKKVSSIKDDFLSMLDRLNAAGENVYVCMNPLKNDKPDAAHKTARYKENIAAVRTVYIEVDENGDGVLEKLNNSTDLPAPALIIESSPHKYHVIWRVENMTVPEQESLLDALIAEFGSDPAASDVTRILRLPSFMNHKYPEKPLVRLLAENPFAARYSLGDFKLSAPASDSEAGDKTPATVTGDLIPYGQHDKELTRIGGKLRHDGMEEDGICSALIEVCEKRCVNYGSDYQEMCAKVAHSVCRYEVGKEYPAHVGKSNAVAIETPEYEDHLESKLVYPEMGNDLISQMARCLCKGTPVPYWKLSLV